ncbi:MAG: HEAT repeat domain-containing protein, partial [Candidatus Hodarchaeota archaeon]
LQSIREAFRENGSPRLPREQKLWISSLERLGKEHQPGIFDLMSALGTPGYKWVTKYIRNNIQSITFGAVASLGDFQESQRVKIIKLLIEKAVLRKRELLPYLAGIVDASTIRYLKPFLSNGAWQERKEVASAIGRVGIQTGSGIIRDIMIDPDWRVKQALVESIDISKSKFSSLLRILEIFVADSHTRVHGSARRLLLRLGNEKCMTSDLETQRNRLMKLFREQLLKAAPVNKDIDSSWLGVDLSEKDPIPYIGPEDTIQDDSRPQPVGIGDFSGVETEGASQTTPSESSGLDLRAALLKKMLESREDIVPPIVIESPNEEDETIESEIDMDLHPAGRLLSMMDQISESLGKAIPVMVLYAKASELEMSEEELKETLDQLVKEGTIYMVDEETVRRADIISE